MLAVMIIMFEIMGLASLISEEVQSGTARALLVTPMRITEFFTAKSIMGVGLAFVQAIIIMGIIGGLTSQPLIMLITLLLGGVLVTGVGFLVASVAKNMMSVMSWGVLAIILFTIPALGVLFPGTVSDWIKILPSYYLVDSITQVSNYGSGWGEVWGSLLILVGFNIVILWGGIMLLRRKFR
jgi:ABC-2 type transport system permease protein